MKLKQTPYYGVIVDYWIDRLQEDENRENKREEKIVNDARAYCCKYKELTQRNLLRHLTNKGYRKSERENAVQSLLRIGDIETVPLEIKGKGRPSLKLRVTKELLNSVL